MQGKWCSPYRNPWDLKHVLPNPQVLWLSNDLRDPCLSRCVGGSSAFVGQQEVMEQFTEGFANLEEEDEGELCGVFCRRLSLCSSQGCASTFPLRRHEGCGFVRILCYCLPGLRDTRGVSYRAVYYVVQAVFHGAPLVDRMQPDSRSTWWICMNRSLSTRRSFRLGQRGASTPDVVFVESKGCEGFWEKLFFTSVVVMLHVLVTRQETRERRRCSACGSIASVSTTGTCTSTTSSLMFRTVTPSSR